MWRALAELKPFDRIIDGKRAASVGTGAMSGILVDGPGVDQFAIVRKHSISVRVRLGISKSEQTLAYLLGFFEVDATANDPIHYNRAIMVQSKNFDRERLLVDHLLSMQLRSPRFKGVILPYFLYG